MTKKNNTIINKTPHDVVLVSDKRNVIKTFPRASSPLRLEQSTEKVGAIGDIPISKTSFGGSKLPEEKEGTIYIVSSLLCQAYPDRGDFYIPNETVRDENGRIIGCNSLSRNPFSGSSSKLRKIKEFIYQSGSMEIPLDPDDINFGTIDIKKDTGREPQGSYSQEDWDDILRNFIPEKINGEKLLSFLREVEND